MNGAGNDNLVLLQRMLAKPPPAGERCDFCATSLGSEHRHVIELAQRRILCTCRACSIVFEPEGAAQGKYRAVPSRYVELSDFTIGEAQWDALAVPIGLAFFFSNSLEGKVVAFYPSPAGAIESQLPLDAWSDIAAGYPALSSLKPDVEAAIVQRTREASRAFIVPIDAAYELVGIIRTVWKGFDGGTDAHAAIALFFDKLHRRSCGDLPARMS